MANFFLVHPLESKFLQTMFFATMSYKDFNQSWNSIFKYQLGAHTISGTKIPLKNRLSSFAKRRYFVP